MATADGEKEPKPESATKGAKSGTEGVADRMRAPGKEGLQPVLASDVRTEEDMAADKEQAEEEARLAALGTGPRVSPEQAQALREGSWGGRAPGTDDDEPVYDARVSGNLKESTKEFREAEAAGKTPSDVVKARAEAEAKGR